MKTWLAILATAAAHYAVPVMAHVGPDAIDRHLGEHILIAIAIGLPLGFGLLRLMKGSGDQRR